VPHEGGQVVDRPVQPGFAPPARGAQRAFGVAHHRGGIADGLFGDPGQLRINAPTISGRSS
jgi:hypothetical protein